MHVLGVGQLFLYIFAKNEASVYSGCPTHLTVHQFLLQNYSVPFKRIWSYWYSDVFSQNPSYTTYEYKTWSSRQHVLAEKVIMRPFLRTVLQ
jgi:hypothetical protein